MLRQRQYEAYSYPYRSAFYFLASLPQFAYSYSCVCPQNAAYLASEKGLDIVGTVSSALINAKLDKQSPQKVLIQSEDTSVLAKFKDTPSYERVLHIPQSISGAPDQVAQEVKKYADAVFVHRDGIVLSSDYIINFTNTVSAFHAANISVYAGVMKNEFQNLIFDYISDPYVELSTFYSRQVDGFITDFPATADMFASKQQDYLSKQA